jgi:hypothetical protein
MRTKVMIQPRRVVRSLFLFTTPRKEMDSYEHANRSQKRYQKRSQKGSQKRRNRCQPGDGTSYSHRRLHSGRDWPLAFLKAKNPRPFNRPSSIQRLRSVAANYAVPHARRSASCAFLSTAPGCERRSHVDQGAHHSASVNVASSRTVWLLGRYGQLFSGCRLRSGVCRLIRA